VAHRLADPLTDPLPLKLGEGSELVEDQPALGSGEIHWQIQDLHPHPEFREDGQGGGRIRHVAEATVKLGEHNHIPGPQDIPQLLAVGPTLQGHRPGDILINEQGLE
jgi:hypothetical protein